MSDQGAIPLGLAQQRAAKNVDPEQLESMGKRAAVLFEGGSGTLSESVVEVVKEARLAPEQVKRVCEFANTSAYLREFEKSGSQKNVTFEGGPADPSVVLKDLNDGSSPAIHQVKTAAYVPPTSDYRMTGSDRILAEAFGQAEDLTKTAQVVDHTTRASAGEEIADLRIRLGAVRDDLLSKQASCGVLLHDVRTDLCDTVRQEVLKGTTLHDIGSAWNGYTNSGMWKEAMQMVSKHLQENGLEKHASITEPTTRVGNPSHPVIDQFLVYTKVASDYQKIGYAIDIVKEQLKDVNDKLRGLE